MGAAIIAEPNNPDACNRWGMIALSEGDAAAAVEAFSRATAADPGELALWMNLATAHRAMADDLGERAALQQALDLDRRHFMANLRMAELLERLKELGEASLAWRNVLQMAASIENKPQALVDRLAEAQVFVDRQVGQLADHVDEATAPLLEQADSPTARRFRACMDHLFGRRALFANECQGIHYPFLPADEYFDREHFPWMAELEAKTDIIRAEFLAMIEKGRAPVRPYVRQDAGTPQNKWTALDGSLNWGAAFLWEYGVRNDVVCDACPQTVGALEALPRADIPGRSPSAFFSLLRPKSRIPAHTGVTNTRAIIHLPLIVPPGCFFRVGGETRPWEEGVAFAFDDTIEHEAWNDSDHLRVVLIFDVWNPHLSLEEQHLLKQFYATADASKAQDSRLSI